MTIVECHNVDCIFQETGDDGFPVCSLDDITLIYDWKTHRMDCDQFTTDATDEEGEL